jgi:hypothetical protein
MAVAVATLFDLDGAVFDRCLPSAAQPSVHLTAERLEGLSLRESATPSDEAGLTCGTCGLGASTPFPSLAAQREHFRGDFHRYNLKRRLAGLPPCTVEEFESILAQGDGEELGSLSGTDTSYSSEGEGDGRNGTGITSPLEARKGSSASRYFSFHDPGKHARRDMNGLSGRTTAAGTGREAGRDGDPSSMSFLALLSLPANNQNTPPANPLQIGMRAMVSGAASSPLRRMLTLRKAGMHWEA